MQSRSCELPVPVLPPYHKVQSCWTMKYQPHPETTILLFSPLHVSESVEVASSYSAYISDVWEPPSSGEHCHCATESVVNCQFLYCLPAITK